MTEGISRPWYENALLLAVAGSLIAVIGQLVGTIIPIMYGPEDVSDFSIGVAPVEGTLLLFPEDNYSFAMVPPDWYVKVHDAHAHLRPYQFGVLLKSSEAPEVVSLDFHPPEIHPGEASRMNFTVFKSIVTLEDGGYPITIQGLGGDGRRRNTTFYLNVLRGNRKAYEESLKNSTH